MCISLDCGCKGTTFFRTAKTFGIFFSKKFHFPCFSMLWGAEWWEKLPKMSLAKTSSGLGKDVAKT
jgi:hypothetical protein